MFSVEVSRNNTTLLTSFILLDLIKARQVYGKRNVPFDRHNAFVSRNDYKWDDAEEKNYGGKYPMSQLSTGKGNLGQGTQNYGDDMFLWGRGDIFAGEEVLGILPAPSTTPIIQYTWNYSHTEDELIILEKYPQRHSVPRREMSLAAHWSELLLHLVSEIISIA